MAYQILNWDKSVKEVITDEQALDLIENGENHEGHFLQFDADNDVWVEFKIDENSSTFVLKKVEEA